MNEDEITKSEIVNIKAGEEWLVVTCHNQACRRLLLIEPVRPEMLGGDGALLLPAGSFEVICHHCKSESSYQSDEIRVEAGQQKH